MEVEYTGPEPEPEIVTQQYAVRAVVDTLQKKVCQHAFIHPGGGSARRIAYKNKPKISTHERCQTSFKLNQVH